MEIVAWWAFLLGVWLVTLNTFAMSEVMVAAVLAVPCAIAARAARRAGGLRWRLDPGWSRWLLRLPAAIAHDTAAALLLGLRRQSREDDDEFRVVELPAGRRAGREAVALATLSATPGSVVVDAKRSELLVHSLPIGRTSLERELRR